MCKHITAVQLITYKNIRPFICREKNKLTSLWSIKLHYKLIKSAQNCDFMLTLNAE